MYIMYVFIHIIYDRHIYLYINICMSINIYVCTVYMYIACQCASC